VCSPSRNARGSFPNTTDLLNESWTQTPPIPHPASVTAGDALIFAGDFYVHSFDGVQTRLTDGANDIYLHGEHKVVSRWLGYVKVDRVGKLRGGAKKKKPAAGPSKVRNRAARREAPKKTKGKRSVFKNLPGKTTATKVLGLVAHAPGFLGNLAAAANAGLTAVGYAIPEATPDSLGSVKSGIHERSDGGEITTITLVVPLGPQFQNAGVNSGASVVMPMTGNPDGTYDVPGSSSVSGYVVSPSLWAAVFDSSNFQYWRCLHAALITTSRISTQSGGSVGLVGTQDPLPGVLDDVNNIVLYDMGSNTTTPGSQLPVAWLYGYSGGTSGVSALTYEQMQILEKNCFAAPYKDQFLDLGEPLNPELWRLTSTQNEFASWSVQVPQDGGNGHVVFLPINPPTDTACFNFNIVSTQITNGVTNEAIPVGTPICDMFVMLKLEFKGAEPRNHGVIPPQYSMMFDDEDIKAYALAKHKAKPHQALRMEVPRDSKLSRKLLVREAMRAEAKKREDEIVARVDSSLKGKAEAAPDMVWQLVPKDFPARS